MQASVRPVPTLDVLSRSGLLWYERRHVALNALDEALCIDAYNCYRARRSKLYLYPIPSSIAPALFVASLLLNSFAQAGGRSDRVPRVLFYTGIDGRDFYDRLGVGVQYERIADTFGCARLNGEGLPIGGGRLASTQSLVMTGQCVLPKGDAFKPDVLVIDANAFEMERLTELLEKAVKRWPNVVTLAVTGDPLTPLIGFASRHRWGLADKLKAAPRLSAADIPRDRFDEIAKELNQAAGGLERTITDVAEYPSARWRELLEPLALARRNISKLATARIFTFVCKWLLALAVRPSEFEENRLQLMRSFDDYVTVIRDKARHEGATAKLIAGASVLLNDIRDDLERTNQKREALLEAILDGYYANRSVAVLVQKPGMRAILTQSVQLLPEFMEMLADRRLLFLSVSQLSRAEPSDVLIVPAILPMRSLWALRAAVAPAMRFITYDVENQLLEWCLREIGVLPINENVPKEHKGSNNNEATLLTAQHDDEASYEIGDLLADESEERTPTLEGASGTGLRRAIYFDDGTSAIVADSATVQVIVDDDDPVHQKKASQIEMGDFLLVIDGVVTQALFDVLREKADSHTVLSRAIEIVKAFHRALCTHFEESLLSIDALHSKLVALGSSIVLPGTVLEWIEGKRFGPNDPRDIERLGRCLNIAAFQGSFREFYGAMQRVRIAHRELGRTLVRLIKSAYNDADTRSLRFTVDGETIVLYDIVDAVAIKRVVETRIL